MYCPQKVGQFILDFQIKHWCEQKKNKGPSIDPSLTPALTSAQEDS